jgi:hypothetical protein
MKFKKRIKYIIITGIIIISSILFLLDRNSKIKKYNEVLHYLDFVINVEDYPELERFKSKSGEYPRLQRIVYDSIYNVNNRKEILEMNPTRRILSDPFNDTFLVYQPLIINDLVIDYLIYSIGPDGNDENRKLIELFNKGQLDTLEVKFRLPNDRIGFFDNLNFDVLVYIPYKFMMTGKFKNLYYGENSKYNIKVPDDWTEFEEY